MLYCTVQAPPTSVGNVSAHEGIIYLPPPWSWCKNTKRARVLRPKTYTETKGYSVSTPTGTYATASIELSPFRVRRLNICAVKGSKLNAFGCIESPNRRHPGFCTPS